MKKMKIALGIAAIAGAGFFMMSADHIDAPAVKGGTSDITDFYAFQAENTNNLVFVANVQGLLSPSATGAAKFDENTLIEFNIDTNKDQKEDWVIQAIARNGKMYFYGPVAPSSTTTTGKIETTGTKSWVDISEYGKEAMIGTNGEMKFFAGPRDDPFFMDFAKYTEIVTGKATQFNNPGTDTFAGTNVLSIVVEVPKSMVGTSGTIDTWVEAKTKQ